MKKLNCLPLESEIRNKNFFEGLKLLKLTKNDFKLNVGEYGNGTMYDLDFKGTYKDEIEGQKEIVITYTINDNKITDAETKEEVMKLKGYWQYLID